MTDDTPPLPLYAQTPIVVLAHPELTPLAKTLYAVMHFRAGARGHFFDSLGYLCTAVGLSPGSPNSVRRAITALEDVNAVRVERSVKPNGHNGGNVYHVLPWQGITGTTEAGARDLLRNTAPTTTGTLPEPLANAKQVPAPEEPPAWLEEPHEDTSPRDTDGTTGTPPFLTRNPPPSSTGTPPLPQEDDRPYTYPIPPEDLESAASPDGEAATRRAAHEHAAQWHHRPGETSRDRAVRLLARALTTHHGQDVLPRHVQYVVEAGHPDEGYASLTEAQRDTCDVVEAIRTHNTNHLLDTDRLSDDRILTALASAISADALTDISDYLWSA